MQELDEVPHSSGNVFQSWSAASILFQLWVSLEEGILIVLHCTSSDVIRMNETRIKPSNAFLTFFFLKWGECLKWWPLMLKPSTHRACIALASLAQTFSYCHCQCTNMHLTHSWHCMNNANTSMNHLLLQSNKPIPSLWYIYMKCPLKTMGVVSAYLPGRRYSSLYNFLLLDFSAVKFHLWSNLGLELMYQVVNS